MSQRRASGYDDPNCVALRDEIASPPAGIAAPLPLVVVAFQLTIQSATPTRLGVCGAGNINCITQAGLVWQDELDAAEESYDRTSACTFTTFPAYEWTNNLDGYNLHRNIIFRNAEVPSLPTSYYEAPLVEGLFSALETGCLDAPGNCDFVSIPHNSNVSGGLMFEPASGDGSPLTQAAAERRSTHETLVEMFQHKGISECHPCEQAERAGDLRPVRGYACRGEDRRTVYAPREVIRDLAGLPFPLRTEKLLARSGGTVLGSRGCCGSCSFCYINGFYGAEPGRRGRSPENIHAEVRALLPLLTRAYIYFADANFFGPGERGQVRAEQIADALEAVKGLSFGLECRVNDVREQSLSRLGRAGLRDVFLGIESGSQPCLDRMVKRTTVQENARALSLLRDYGIEPHVGFIMFQADSTIEDLRLSRLILPGCVPLAALKDHTCDPRSRSLLPDS